MMEFPWTQTPPQIYNPARVIVLTISTFKMPANCFIHLAIDNYLLMGHFKLILLRSATKAVYTHWLERLHQLPTALAVGTNELFHVWL